MPKNPPDSASDRTKTHPKTPARAPGGGLSGQPVFAQPKPSPDPTGFKDPVTDQKFQGIRNLEAVPQPRGGAVEPIVTLEQVYGSAGAAKVAIPRTRSSSAAVTIASVPPRRKPAIHTPVRSVRACSASTAARTSASHPSMEKSPSEGPVPRNVNVKPAHPASRRCLMLRIHSLGPCLLIRLNQRHLRIKNTQARVADLESNVRFSLRGLRLVAARIC